MGGEGVASVVAKPGYLCLRRPRSQFSKPSCFGQKTKLSLENLLSKVEWGWGRTPEDFLVSEAQIE